MFEPVQNSTTQQQGIAMTATEENRSIQPPDELAALRHAWRRDLLARRAGLEPEARAAADMAINAALARRLADIEGILGFYWPIRGEFDAREAVSAWLAANPARRAVLPVVVKRDAPLKFRAWSPGSAMQGAGFGTSVPAHGEWLDPTHLLVPLVGFDTAGYRLGYGGGYYDRTMAALPYRPGTTGIGFDACRLDSIIPQHHDLQLDYLITA
jgi:5,10-methenyltetrahydrofolate synthetase